MQHKTAQNDNDTSLDRLECDVRIRFLHRNNQQESDTDDDDKTYDPKIYVKLKNWEPDPSKSPKLKMNWQHSACSSSP
jgi:hypothetical protein